MNIYSYFKDTLDNMFFLSIHALALQPLVRLTPKFAWWDPLKAAQ